MKLKFTPEQIELLPSSSLAAYPKNPRKHPDEQIDKIAASMETFGWTTPVLIDDKNEVIAGHGRLLAAEKVGVERIPCIRLRHLTPEQVKACRLADNQLTIIGEWDNELLAFEIHDLNADGFDLDLLGFDTSMLDSLLAPIEDAANGGEEQQTETTLAERFGIPPFSVFNAREGWWQDRKRAWIDLGIKSELGRGEAAEPQQRYKANAIPGGGLMPACDYSKSRSRGDGRGRAIEKT